MLKHLLCLVAILGLAGCVDPGAAGATGDTALYAYDNTAKRVLVWGDLPAAFEAGALPTPTAILSTTSFDNLGSMAWGGLAFDSTRNRLYLVGETGNIIRLDSVRGLSGSVPSANLVSFKLDTGSRLDGSKFGQAAIDTTTDSLYVTENGTSSTRIWVVAGASSRAQSSTVSLQSLAFTNDTGGYGVAAHTGVVYGTFTNGDGVSSSPVLTGPRIRKGSSSSFDPSLVILGDQTELGTFGTLALDHSNGIVYVGVSGADATGAVDPVLAFKTGQFGGSFNQAPDHVAGDLAVVGDLRVLSSPGNKDWLAGLSASQGTTLWLWKNPSSKSSTVFKALTAPSGSVLRGVTMDGTP
jgi:hypothetical protein